MPKYSSSSKAKLSTVKKPLQDLFNAVIEEMDCTIVEGKRTVERQQELYSAGRSHTMSSKHLTGDAVDVTPYPIDWEDKDRQYKFATLVFDTAMRMGIRVRWGGWFRAPNDEIFYDSPHWQLVEED